MQKNSRFYQQAIPQSRQEASFLWHSIGNHENTGKLQWIIDKSMFRGAVPETTDARNFQCKLDTFDACVIIAWEEGTD